MSWDQGIQLRKDLPVNFIRMAEIKYYDMFGEHANLQYITWFGLGDVIYADFGDGNNSLEFELKFKQRIDHNG